MSKPKIERFTSPKGVAQWPRLNEPDYKYKPEGEFSVKLAYDPADADVSKMVKTLEKRRDELFQQWLSENPKKKKTAEVAPVFADEVDEDGDETGRITMTFKMRHKVTSKKTKKTFTLTPDIFDAHKRLMKNPPKVGSGSTLRVSFEIGGFFVESAKKFYLTMRMVAVQVIDLVEFGVRDAGSYGFDEEDGGFEADDNHTTAASKSDDDDGDGDDDSGNDDGDGDDGDY